MNNKFNENEMAVLSMIGVTPIHLRDIRDYTGFSYADIKYMIMHLRENYPICSGNNGYWLGTDVDMQNMIRDFECEIATKQQVVRDMKDVLRRM